MKGAKKQSSVSGVTGERDSDPRQHDVWRKLFPNTPFPNDCKFLTGAEFLDWLSQKGFSFHNSSTFDKLKGKTKCSICDKYPYKGKKQPISSQGVLAHLRAKHPSHIEIENIGLFINDESVGEIYEPDHVLLCEDSKKITIFENKNGDDPRGGSVEEKPSTSNYKHDHYCNVLSKIGYNLDWYVFTVRGNRYKSNKPVSNSKFRAQSEYCVNKGGKLIFYNFEDGFRNSSLC